MKTNSDSKMEKLPARKRSFNYESFDVSTLANLDVVGRREHARRDNLPTEVANWLMLDEDPRVRRDLAQNQFIEPSILSYLSADADDVVAKNAAANNAQEVKRLEEMALDKKLPVAVQLSLAQNRKLPESAIDAMSSGRRVRVAGAIAGREDLPKSSRQKLESDSRWRVRLALAEREVEPLMQGAKKSQWEEELSAELNEERGQPFWALDVGREQKNRQRNVQGASHQQAPRAVSCKSSESFRGRRWGRSLLDNLSSSPLGLSLLLKMRASQLPEVVLLPLVTSLEINGAVAAAQEETNSDENQRLLEKKLAEAWKGLVNSAGGEQRLQMARCEALPKAITNRLLSDGDERVREAAARLAEAECVTRRVKEESSEVVLSAMGQRYDLPTRAFLQLARSCSPKVAEDLLRRRAQALPHEALEALAERFARLSPKLAAKLAKRPLSPQSAAQLSASRSVKARSKAAASGLLAASHMAEQIRGERQAQVKSLLRRSLRRQARKEAKDGGSASSANQALMTSYVKERRVIRRYLQKWEDMLRQASGEGRDRDSSETRERLRSAALEVQASLRRLPKGHCFFTVSDPKLRRAINAFFTRWSELLGSYTLPSSAD